MALSPLFALHTKMLSIGIYDIASYSSSLYQQNLHLRRTLSKPLSINKLKVKKMCEWRSKEKNSHDDLIAVKVLRSKSRYSEVIALMKFKSEHQ